MANATVANPVRLAVVEDHEIYRMGLVSFLKNRIECEICLETGESWTVIGLLQRVKVEVVLVDMGLPRLNGLELTRQIRKNYPDIEVIILTGDERVASRAFEAGAKASLEKTESVDHLVEAIKAVREHRCYLTNRSHQSLIQKSISLNSDDPLTSREREVIQLLAEGLSNKEVATFLGVSIKTVETHRSTIMRKLKFVGLSELVIFAIQNKIAQM